MKDNKRIVLGKIMYIIGIIFLSILILSTFGLFLSPETHVEFQDQQFLLSFIIMFLLFLLIGIFLMYFGHKLKQKIIFSLFNNSEIIKMQKKEECDICHNNKMCNKGVIHYGFKKSYKEEMSVGAGATQVTEHINYEYLGSEDAYVCNDCIIEYVSRMRRKVLYILLTMIISIAFYIGILYKIGFDEISESQESLIIIGIVILGAFLFWLNKYRKISKRLSGQVRKEFQHLAFLAGLDDIAESLVKNDILNSVFSPEGKVVFWNRFEYESMFSKT